MEADRVRLEGLQWRAEKLAGDVAAALSKPMARAVVPAEVQAIIRELSALVRDLAAEAERRADA